MTRNREQQRRYHMRLVWTGAVLLCAAPVFSIGGTVLGMHESFEVIEAMTAPTPADLAAGVRTSLGASLIGIAVGLIGAGLFVPSLIALHRFDRRHAQATVVP